MLTVIRNYHFFAVWLFAWKQWLEVVSYLRLKVCHDWFQGPNLYFFSRGHCPLNPTQGALPPWPPFSPCTSKTHQLPLILSHGWNYWDVPWKSFNFSPQRLKKFSSNLSNPNCHCLLISHLFLEMELHKSMRVQNPAIQFCWHCWLWTMCQICAGNE